MKRLLCVCIIVVLLYGFYRYVGKIEVYSAQSEKTYVSTESIPEAEKEVEHQPTPAFEVVGGETVRAKVSSMDFTAIQPQMDITPEENLLYLEGYLRILKNEIPTYNKQGEELYYKDLWKAGIEFQELLEARDQKEYPYLYYYDDLDGDGKPEMGIKQGCVYILKYELGDDKFAILYSQQTCYFKKIIGVGQIWYHDGLHGSIIRDRLIVLNEENEWEKVLDLERGLNPDFRYYLVGTEDMDQVNVSEEEWNEITMPFFEMAEDSEVPLQTLEEVFRELLESIAEEPKGNRMEAKNIY